MSTTEESIRGLVNDIISAIDVQHSEEQATPTSSTSRMIVTNELPAISTAVEEIRLQDVQRTEEELRKRQLLDWSAQNRASDMREQPAQMVREIVQITNRYGNSPPAPPPRADDMWTSDNEEESTPQEPESSHKPSKPLRRSSYTFSNLVFKNSNNSNTRNAAYNSRFDSQPRSTAYNVRDDAESQTTAYNHPADNYQCMNTKPTAQFPIPNMISDSFAPRVLPRYLSNYFETQAHQIRPTEYLIVYCNQYAAVGMIKKHSDYKYQPLVIQFGHYKQFIGSTIYTGCTVIVRSYAKIHPSSKITSKDPRTLNRQNLLVEGCLSPEGLAIEWGIVHKPEIIRSLGTVSKFNVSYRPHGRLRYEGEVFDQEYKEKLRVSDDSWPAYIKIPPAMGSAVIVNWIPVTEPHIFYMAPHGLRMLLPAYANNYHNVGDKHLDYYFGWVDTSYAAR